MKLLDAVNLVLPRLGEHAVTKLDTKHPTLAVILPAIENELITVLLKGWWFNTFEYTAYPDPEGRIALGTDTLSFVSRDVPSALRGVELFNPKTLNYVWDEPVVGCIKQRVDFDDLPESAAQYVFYTGLVTSYTTDLGVTQDLQVWMTKAGEAYSELLAEHLRNQKYSTTRSRRFRNLRRAMRS